MKNRQVKKKEFYIHQIKRDTQPQVSEPVKKVTTSKTVPSYYDSVGFHESPSRYDHLRQPKVTYQEPEVQNEPVYEEKEDIYVDTYADNYYGTLADNYQEVDHDEAIVEEIITEDEIEYDEPVEEVPYEEEVQSTPKPSQIVVDNVTKVTRKRVKRYTSPSTKMLTKGTKDNSVDEELALKQTKIINDILANYGIKAHVAKHLFAPTVIMYLIQYDSLTEDVKSIRKAEQNLSLYLATKNIRILTPIPGMSYSGIEVPRPAESRGTVYLSDMINDKAFINSKMKLPVAVGQDCFGTNIFIDIYDMPHGLCAGATKSGKSVCLNTFILSLLIKHTPDELRLILLDPKIVEFAKYSDIPHLAMPVITDGNYFESVVSWLTDEMERRYQILNKNDCTELAELNKVLAEQNQPKIPFLVMIMDEFNDWFAKASNDCETNITRLMQKARAAGIHIILATQHPSADVIKGAIKANITTRLAFSVSSPSDSIVIIGRSGAEKLEGRGDLIIRHTGLDEMRLQAAFTTSSDVKAIVNELREKNDVDYLVTLEELEQSSASRGPGNGSSAPNLGRNDELFEEVAYYVVRNNLASANQMQKIFGTGFNRMDLIFTDLAKLGIISPAQQGAKRRVLVDELQLEEILKSI